MALFYLILSNLARNCSLAWYDVLHQSHSHIFQNCEFLFCLCSFRSLAKTAEIDSNAVDIRFTLDCWLHSCTQQTCNFDSSSHLLLRCQEHNLIDIGYYTHYSTSSFGIFCANRITSDGCYPFYFSAIQSSFQDPVSHSNSFLDLTPIITDFVSWFLIGCWCFVSYPINSRSILPMHLAQPQDFVVLLRCLLWMVYDLNRPRLIASMISWWEPHCFCMTLPLYCLRIYMNFLKFCFYLRVTLIAHRYSRLSMILW